MEKFPLKQIKPNQIDYKNQFVFSKDHDLTLFLK